MVMMTLASCSEVVMTEEEEVMTEEEAMFGLQKDHGELNLDAQESN